MQWAGCQWLPWVLSPWGAFTGRGRCAFRPQGQCLVSRSITRQGRPEGFCRWRGRDECAGLCTVVCGSSLPHELDRALSGATPPAKPGRARGLQPVPRIADRAAFLPFSLLARWAMLQAALCFRDEKGSGWDMPHLCLPAEPAATPAQPAPPQAQGGCSPEDAGIRAHDPLPRVLGGCAALCAPQPPRECEQRRDPYPQLPEAQGRTRPPRKLWTGQGGRRAHAEGSFQPSLTFSICEMGHISALLPPWDKKMPGECPRVAAVSPSSSFPRLSSALVRDA